MAKQATHAPARYRVEHMDTEGVWHKSHRGTFVSYSKALAKRDEVGAFGRIMANYFSNVWEEVTPHVGARQDDTAKLEGFQKGFNRLGGNCADRDWNAWAAGWDARTAIARAEGR